MTNTATDTARAQRPAITEPTDVMFGLGDDAGPLSTATVHLVDGRPFRPDLHAALCGQQNEWSWMFVDRGPGLLERLCWHCLQELPAKLQVEVELLATGTQPLLDETSRLTIDRTEGYREWSYYVEARVAFRVDMRSNPVNCNGQEGDQAINEALAEMIRRGAARLELDAGPVQILKRDVGVY